jgi:hypothetical protein
MAGGNLEALAKITGNTSAAITQHYAHLLPDFFGANANDMVAANLTRPAGNVVPFVRDSVPDGQELAKPARHPQHEIPQKSQKNKALRPTLKWLG